MWYECTCEDHLGIVGWTKARQRRAHRRATAISERWARFALPTLQRNSTVKQPLRHCEHSEAIQKPSTAGTLDCFVASLLAMTTGARSRVVFSLRDVIAMDPGGRRRTRGPRFERQHIDAVAHADPGLFVGFPFDHLGLRRIC